jgi:prepilin-type N-terminal cleavage/methylation domain-containing protein
MQKFKKNRSAFTMIEVMMMILIVAIMSSIALPATNNFFAGNRLAAAASILIQDVRRARYRAMQTGLS